MIKNGIQNAIDEETKQRAKVERKLAKLVESQSAKQVKRARSDEETESSEG